MSQYFTVFSFLILIANYIQAQDCSDYKEIRISKGVFHSENNQNLKAVNSVHINGVYNRDLELFSVTECLKKLIIIGEFKNEITVLPDEFSNAKNLEFLKIVNLNLLDWENTFKIISSFTRLKELTIESSSLSAIPENFLLPKSLKKIILKDNNLIKVPVNIYHIDSLEYLDLQKNKINFLSPKIENLQQLKYLILYENMLESIPKELGNLVSLEELYLSNNFLTKIPPEIGMLKQLSKLSLSANRLSQLPSEFNNLFSLKKLILSHNNFTFFPNEIINLHELNYINISNNKLKSIPYEIGLLNKIKHLDVSQNEITDLPENIIDLHSFDTRGNNFKFEPSVFIHYKLKVDSLIKIEKNFTSLMLAFHAECQRIDHYNDSISSINLTEQLKKYPDIPDMPLYKNIFKQDFDCEHITHSFLTPKGIDIFIDESKKELFIRESIPEKVLLLNFKCIEKLYITEYNENTFPNDISALTQLRIVSLETRRKLKIKKLIITLSKLQSLEELHIINITLSKRQLKILNKTLSGIKIITYS